MDHDVTGADIRGAGSAIFSTYPSCTLATLQFVHDENRGLNREELLRVVKDIGQIDDPTAQDAIDHALDLTRELLGRSRGYNPNDFFTHGITNPLNDHKLAHAILIASGKPTADQERYRVEDMIRANSLQDCNLLGRELFGRMLSALFNRSTDENR